MDEEISASQSKTVKVPQLPLAQFPLLLHPFGKKIGGECRVWVLFHIHVTRTF